MVAVIAAIMACVYCLFTRGIRSLHGIPVPDEPPAFPTREPISVASPIFIDPSTGVPIYLYTNAMATRDT